MAMIKPKMDYLKQQRSAVDPFTATEIACRLMKSGAIAPIKPKQAANRLFKHPIPRQFREKNLPASPPPKPVFSHSHRPDPRLNPNVVRKTTWPTNKYKKSFNYEPTTEWSTGYRTVPPPGQYSFVRKYGHTIIVKGYNLNEWFLRKHFRPFGTILYISMELLNERAFLTFQNPNSAKRSIAALHFTEVEGIHLNIQWAHSKFEISSADFLPEDVKEEEEPLLDNRDLVKYVDDIFDK